MNYQMFRHAKNPSRCCAIRDGDCFPQVLGPNEWAEAEYLDEREPRPPGFDEAAVQYACAVQGFYLFTWGGRAKQRLTSPPVKPRLPQRNTGIVKTSPSVQMTGGLKVHTIKAYARNTA
jgi:hypothetical protein